eukprot:1161311-Pelagomonas_calceolata.AAC.17
MEGNGGQENKEERLHTPGLAVCINDMTLNSKIIRDSPLHANLWIPTIFLADRRVAADDNMPMPPKVRANKSICFKHAALGKLRELWMLEGVIGDPASALISQDALQAVLQRALALAAADQEAPARPSNTDLASAGSAETTDGVAFAGAPKSARYACGGPRGSSKA